MATSFLHKNLMERKQRVFKEVNHSHVNIQTHRDGSGSAHDVVDTAVATTIGNGENKSIQCPQCNKTFSTKQSLSTHMKTAKYCLEKKTKRVFECEYCGKRLSSKQMMLYHDDICSMKRQYMYDKQLEEIQKRMSNSYALPLASNTGASTEHDPSSIVPPPMTAPPTHHPGDSKSFYQMNVIVQCRLLSELSKIPTKLSGLAYRFYTCVDRSLTVEPLSSATVYTGVALSIPTGWCASVLTDDTSSKDLLVIHDLMDCHVTTEVQIRVFNMSNRCVTIEGGQSIARIVFQKHVDMFNVHLNCHS